MKVYLQLQSRTLRKCKHTRLTITILPDRCSFAVNFFKLIWIKKTTPGICISHFLRKSKQKCCWKMSFKIANLAILWASIFSLLNILSMILKRQHKFFIRGDLYFRPKCSKLRRGKPIVEGNSFSKTNSTLSIWFYNFIIFLNWK